jgi:EpsI family protein
LRCVGIILLAHFTDNKYGAGADHIVYGWGFNVAILLVLIVLGSLFRDEIPESTSVPSRNPATGSGASLAVVTAIAAVLISTGPAFAWWRDTRSALPDVTATADYLHADGWQDKDGGNWSPHFPGADAHLMMSSAPASGAPVDLFVGYYARPRAGHTMTAHLNLPWDENVWNGATNALTSAPLGPSTVQLQESVINSGAEKRLVWSVYWVDGHFTPSLLAVKLLQAKAGLEGREGQAFVALSTPVDGPAEDARARLARALSGLGQLSQALDHANMPAAASHEGAR